jgi:hypothetical protein
LADTPPPANYLGDTWAFDLTEYKWREITFPLTAQKPCARSGMSLLPCAEGVVLSGGYAKMYEKGKKTKGVALEDTWTLRSVSIHLRRAPRCLPQLIPL